MRILLAILLTLGLLITAVVWLPAYVVYQLILKPIFIWPWRFIKEKEDD